MKQTCLGRFWPACVSHASCAETTSRPPFPSVTKPPTPSVTTGDQGWVNSLVFLCWQGTYVHLNFGHLNAIIGLSLYKNIIFSFSFFSWRQWFPVICFLRPWSTHQMVRGEENGSMLCHRFGLNGDDENLNIHIEGKSTTSKSMCSKLQYWKCFSVLFWLFFWILIFHNYENIF